MSGDTKLISIVFEPGIQKNTTEYMAEGYWVDCDKIRFKNSRPEKIGGWVRETLEQYEDSTNNRFTGVSRATLSWSDLNSNKYFASASHLKVELLTGGKVHDITPIRESVSLTNAITTNSSNEIQITDVNHGTTVGDYVKYSNQGSAVDGVTLSGQYQVINVIDADNYVIYHPVTASGSTALGGGNLDVKYLLQNGAQSNGSLTGWSGGTWGTPGQSSQGWNRPRAGEGGLKLRQWSLDNWGEDLVACMRDGSIYQWDATNGPLVPLVKLSNAPEQNSFILVSQPSRHLIAFGSTKFIDDIFDPLIIRWSSQEELNFWDISDDSKTAGEYRIPTGNYIVGAVQTRGEIVVFTDTDVYSMRYVGGNDVFQFEPLGTNTSTISQHAAIDVNGVVYWMGADKFYRYNGTIEVLPLSVDKLVFDQDGARRLLFSQKEKTFAGVNKEFNEIIFLYQSVGAEEIDSYIKYNYVEGVSDHGTLNRTTWLDRGTFSKPYALDETGVLYIHEEGKDADGVPLEAFIRSSYFDIGDGQDLLFIDRIIPDVKLPSSRNMEIRCYFKKYPHPQASVVTKGPYYFDDTKKQISMRGRGRAMSIEFRVTGTGTDFEIGKMRIGVQPDGGR